ncbi:hypothetical protein GG496_001104 [Candidatus Fervidibacteria bacterium JGI MDM2 JNZ-1-D12]
MSLSRTKNHPCHWLYSMVDDGESERRIHSAKSEGRVPPDRNSARQRRALRDEKGKLFHASEFSQWLMTEKVSDKSIKRLQ